MKLSVVLKYLYFLVMLASTASADIYREVLQKNIIEWGYLTHDQVNPEFDENLSSIGELLFKNEQLSFNSEISCRSCHLDKFSSTDGLPNAIGVGGSGEGSKRIKSGGLVVPRNVLPLWGRGIANFNPFFWDGKVEEINGEVISQFIDKPPSDNPLIVAAHLPLVEIREMVLDDNRISENFKKEDVQTAYQLFDLIIKKINGTDQSKKLAEHYNILETKLTGIHIASAIAEHIKKHFAVRETKFSQVFKKNNEFTKPELRGGILFYGKGRCIVCHNGPLFSDMKFHNIGFPQLGFGKNGFGVDYGRFNVTNRPDDIYKFRTPPLIEVGNTGPYGHSGSVNTVEEAIIAHFDPLSLIDTKKMRPLDRVTYFNKIQKMNSEFEIPYLDQKEISELVIFLDTLNFIDSD
jgi:cytochrome c peroxidase